MKNHRSYRLTETGIRIPVHKVKWMASPKGNRSKDLDIVAPAKKNFNHLFANNLAALMQSTSSESDDICPDENWEESD